MQLQPLIQLTIRREEDYVYRYQIEFSNGYTNATISRLNHNTLENFTIEKSTMTDKKRVAKDVTMDFKI